MATAAELALLLKVQGSDSIDKALKGVRSNLDATRKEAEKGGGLFGGIVKGLGDIGLASIGIGAVKSAVGALTGPIMDSVAAAESLGDAVARSNAIFKDGWSTDVEESAGRFANSLGMTKEAYISAAAAAGDFFNGMGLSNDAVAEMSLDLTDLAPKLAAFTGKDTATAMNALTKGIGGATKGLKEMGIVIPDIPKGLTAAAEATFIYNEVMKQSADAQAAWAGNSGDVDVSMQRITAAVTDAKAALGEALLPIIAPLAEKLADLANTVNTYLQPALDILKATFTGQWAEGGNAALDRMRELAGPLADVILHVGYAMSDVTDAVSAFMDGDPQGAWDALGNGVYSAIEAFGDLTGIDITGIIDSLFGGDRDTGDGLWASIGEWIVTTKDKMLELWGYAKIAWDGIMLAVETAKPYIIDACKLIWDAAGQLHDKYIELKDQAAVAWSDIAARVEEAKPRIDDAIKNIKQFADDLVKKWEELRDDGSAIWERIASFIFGTRDETQQSIRMMGEDSDWLKNQWQGLIPEAQNAWQSIAGAIAGAGPIIDDVMSNVLGPAWEDLKIVWEELKQTASEVWTRISATVAEKITELKRWWAEHGDSIKLAFAGAYLIVTGIIKVAWNLIIGIIRVALAIVRGDTDGAVEAMKRAWQGAVDGVERILGGLIAIVGAILGDVLRYVGRQAAKIGTAIIDGIWNAITGGNGKVAEAGKGLGDAAVAATKAAVQSESPSKVFHEIGEWIVAGLVNGIDRNSQKAVEAAQKMASGVTSAAQSIVELFATLASQEAQVSTEGLAANFDRLLKAVGPIRNAMLSLGVEVDRVIGKSREYKLIGNAAAALGSIGDAVGSIVDALTALGGTVTTTSGGKGGVVVETITGILPTDAQIAALVDRAKAMLHFMRDLQEVFGAGTGFIGANLLADAVKAMGDTLNAVADVDLSKRVEVTSLQMLTARNMISRMVGVFAEPGGILDGFIRLGEEVRAAVAGGAKDFAELIGALANVVKVAGGFTEKLEFGAVDVAKSADSIVRVLTDIQRLFGQKGGIFDTFARLSEAVRDTVAGAAKDFAELIGSLVKIIESTQIGKIEPALDVSATALRDVLLTLRNLDKSVLQPLRKQLKLTTEQLELMTRDFKAMGDWFGAIAAVVKVSAVGTIVSSIDVSATAMRDVLLALRNLEKSVVSDIRESLRMTLEQLEKATKDFKAMADWFGSIVAVLRVSQVGDIEAGISISATALRDALNALRNLEKAVVGEIREQLRMTTAELEAASKDFKSMAEWFGAIAAVLKTTEIGKIEPALEVSATALRNVLLTIQNLNKAVLEPMRQQLMGMGDLDVMAKDFKTLASFIGAIADILDAVTKLPEAKSIPQLTAEIVDRMLEPIRLLAPAFASLGPTISTAANEALASMGPALDSLGAVFGTLETAIASPFFGSGKRARSSNSMETFKRRIVESIKAAVSTMVDAMSQVSIPADLADKFAPLQRAAEAIKAAFDVLASASVPKDMAAIMAAAGMLGGFGSGGGAAGAGGAGSGGGGDVAGAIWRGLAANLDGWKGDTGCAPPIFKAIASQLDGWKGDTGCAPPIFKAIASQLDGWKGDIGCAPPIFKAIGEQIKAWVQRGSTGTDIADPIMQAVGEQIKAWVQRGSTGQDGGGSSVFGGSGAPAFAFGAAAMTAQTVNLAGPVNVGFTGTFQVGGGRSLAVELVDALIADTGTFDKLIRAEDNRRAQKP